MNFDKILFSIRNEKQVFNRKTPLKKLIKKRFTYKKSSKELFVIFPPLGGHLYLDIFLRHRLLKNNDSVLEYEFPQSILSTNWKFTLKNFNFICKSVIKDIEKLKKEYKFQKIKIIGVSIGCVNACMVANNNSNINKMFLIVPGHCLAECMWNGIATQKIKKSYENQNISLKELKKYWYALAPENNIDNLKFKKISVFLSLADKIIPFRYGERLVKKLKSLKYKIYYEKNKTLGHNLTASLLYLNPRKFLFNKKNKEN